MPQEQSKTVAPTVVKESFTNEGNVKPAQKAQKANPSVVSEIANKYKVNQRLNP